MALEDISGDRRAQIFERVLSDWAAEAPALLECIEKDRREIQQLLAWARANRCLAIASSRQLQHALNFVLDQDHPPNSPVGRQLMCLFAECDLLPVATAEQIPLEWLGDLAAVPDSRHVVVQALLARLESCTDERLVEHMRSFWHFNVWSEADGGSCERAIRLLARWCCEAGQGPSETAFACQVLRQLPLTRLPNLDVLYDSPALPSQAMGVRAVQLAQSAHRAAGEARQVAQEALQTAGDAPWYLTVPFCRFFAFLSSPPK